MGDVLISFLTSHRSSRAFYREAYKRAHMRYKYKRSMVGLEEKGFLTRQGDMVRLTAKGMELADVLASRPVQPTKWGGHWWIVMYDIPVAMNPFRFELRSILIRAGFRKLQQSVWVYPHACRELELFLKNNPNMGAFVRYVETLPFVGLQTMDDWKKLSTV